MLPPNKEWAAYFEQRREQESDRVNDLIVRGIAAVQANSKIEARNYLVAVTRAEDASFEQKTKAWLWLAQITDDSAEKRTLYEQVLAYNPADPQARRGLLILDGKLDASEIINPDTQPAQAIPASPQPVQSKRFVCISCGGKMAFTPDGNSLTCAYCGKKQSLLSALDDGAMVEEHDMFVTMLTQKGHARPVITQSIKCQRCGASFVLPPQMLSQNCPYCASAYVVEQTETRELIQPEGVVPFAISQDQAHHAVFGWYRKQGYKVLSNNALPVGVYLPVWTFDMGGEITWNCMVEAQDNVWIPRTGSYLVYENDLLMTASHALGATLTKEIDGFPLNCLAPYDAGYIADWPAETYQIPVSDASIAARSRVLEKSRRPVEASILGHYRDLYLSTMRLVVESYKLILVPLWISRYHFKDTWYTVVVNGQTGNVRGEKPIEGARKWLSELFGA